MGVYAQGVDGLATISNNNIGNISNGNGESPNGIWLASATNKAIVNNNVIAGVASTVSGNYAASGINVTSGNITINHSIYNNSVSGITSLGTYVNGATGIVIGGATPNVSIYNNKISNIKNNNTSAW